MLQLLLDEIRAGGTLETRALALRLGTTPQLVEAMLAHLQRAGHIQDYAGCTDGCQGCRVRGACRPAPQERLRVWQNI